MNFFGRVAVVTGGSRGIGLGCVKALVGAGGTVVFCAPAGAAEQGHAVAAELTSAGPGRAVFQACNVVDAGERAALIRNAVDKHGRLDCLVNNAGWHPPHRPIDGFTLDECRSLFELNVFAVFDLCRLALPHLRPVRGSILNVASLVATIGQHHATTYVATKGAVLAFTKALAIDEAPHGVRVNSLSPGNVWTPLWQEAVDAAPDPAACRADGDAAQPMGRMGTIDEAGRLCLFLATEATFTTGVDHILSGGAELGYGRKWKPA